MVEVNHTNESSAASLPVALIADNRHLVDGMARFTSAVVTLLGSTVQLVMSGELGQWPEPPYVLWIDVPCAVCPYCEIDEATGSAYASNAQIEEEMGIGINASLHVQVQCRTGKISTTCQICCILLRSVIAP